MPQWSVSYFRLEAIDNYHYHVFTVLMSFSFGVNDEFLNFPKVSEKFPIFPVNSQIPEGNLPCSKFPEILQPYQELMINILRVNDT